jgi:hypothetical protein
MTKTISLIATLLLLGFSSADASNVGVDLNVQIGNQPPPPVIIRERETPPPRVIERYENQTVYDDYDVDFIYPNKLGFYVGVGVPIDLFFINNLYFSYRNGSWYKAHNHRGPWVNVEYRHLPPGLRKHKLERIRYYRDHEYQVYNRDRDHYRGRHSRSEKGEWKEARKAEKHRDKEDRRYERDMRRENKQMEKEDRNHDRGEGRGKHGRD